MLTLIVILSAVVPHQSFTWSQVQRCPSSPIVMQAKRGRRLSKELGSSSKKKRPALTTVEGISAPAEGKLKGWELGESRVRLTAATINGKLYVLESPCTRCAWELEKGEIRGDTVCCALCGQCYSVSTGKPGATVERGWLGSLAQRAPTTKAATPARTVRAAIDEASSAVQLDVAGSFLADELSKK